MHRLKVFSLYSLSLFPYSVMAEVGVDSVSSAFFRDWYQNADLGHYLDNNNPYTVYQTETTGEWNLGDQQVFSISGNSFKNNKYRLNGMRVDSRSRVGSAMLHMEMTRTSMALDYHDGELSFTTDSLPQREIRLTGNAGALGGIMPGTKQLINLFHKSAAERLLDNRPLENRNHIVGAGTMDASFAVKAFDRYYYQHAYVNYGRRKITAFDHTGISGMYDADYYTAQLDGEIPLNSQSSALRYFMVTSGRSDYGSEFLYNANELATHRAYQVGLYMTHRFASGGKMTAGVSYELANWRHDSLSFSRNIMDQDGEGFEPWYADGELHSVNLSLCYDQKLLSWLRVHAEGYNSYLFFHPSQREWTNTLYAQAYVDAAPAYVGTYEWHSAPFSSGILENEAMVIAEHRLAKGLNMYAHLGVSLDGIVLGHGRSVVTPDWLAKFALDYTPVWWFNIGVSVSHHRMSYTWDDIRFLSPDYMNKGPQHIPASNLWMHQPSYAVVDLPIRFTFGKQKRHEIAVLSSLRKYYNQWYTTHSGTDDNYTIGVQPMNILSGRFGCRTPYYASNMVRYTYNGRKWFVQLSWQSYLMSGFSALGNGVLSNNIGILSESTAEPETGQTTLFKDLPYQANGRLDQDRAYIARIQVTYNACKYFSIGFNGKFKDGQPFTNFTVRKQTVDGHTNVSILPMDARGINLANNAFGKREDAFFNFELRATGRWWVNDIPMSLEVQCYNLFDFGTELTEYTFDDYDAIPGRTAMSLCIPRGLLFTFRVGLEKDKQH